MDNGTYLTRNNEKLKVRPAKVKGRLIYSNTCEECGCRFISNRNTAAFCSDKCRGKHFYKMNKI
jgi:hypothetical protein